MSRVISGLEWAGRFEGKWPEGIPHVRARGVKALGVRYEAAVAHQLPGAERGVWWRFCDSNGPGICQTDVLVLGQEFALVLECKHTWKQEGHDQLQYLYIPVVAKATGLRTIGIQVCKNINWAARRTENELEAAIGVAKQHGLATLHWRGVTPLLRTSRAPAHGGLAFAPAPAP